MDANVLKMSRYGPHSLEIDHNDFSTFDANLAETKGTSNSFDCRSPKDNRIIRLITRSHKNTVISILLQ